MPARPLVKGPRQAHNHRFQRPLNRIEPRLLDAEVINHRPGHGRPGIIHLPHQDTTALPPSGPTPLAAPRAVREADGVGLHDLRDVCEAGEIVLDAEILRDVGHQAAFVLEGAVVVVERHGAGDLLGRLCCDVAFYGGQVRVGLHAEFADEAA